MQHKIDMLGAATHVFPNVFLFDGGRYVVATLVMSAILWIVHRTRLRVRKIQRRTATRADYRREMLTSARSVIVYALVSTPALWLRINGYTVAQADNHAPPLVLAAYVFALLVAHDTWFYWTHRAMHHRKLFKLFHRTHHWSVTPTPYAAYAFDWPEAAVQALFVALWFAFVPTPDFAMFLFLGIMIVRNVIGHAGTELHPRGMADHWFWGQITTTTHHDLHHCGNYTSNYGLYFTWWDRVMGTEHKRYHEIYREVTNRPFAQPVEPSPIFADR